jgi:hypothetical protein
VDFSGASALFEWALAETNAQAMSRHEADAELRACDDGLGRRPGRPSSDRYEELRDAPADGDLGEGPLGEDLEAGADVQTGFDAEVGDHAHPDGLPPALREDGDGQELVGELEEAPDVDDDANDGMAAALDPDGCLEDVVLPARQTTEGCNKRGIGAQCDPDLVERSLRHWLASQLYFVQTLRTRLESAHHAEWWGILAAECQHWAPPLLWLAERVLGIPASEAHSMRTISQVGRVLGWHASRTADQRLFSHVHAAMGVTSLMGTTWFSTRAWSGCTLHCGRILHPFRVAHRCRLKC